MRLPKLRERLTLPLFRELWLDCEEERDRFEIVDLLSLRDERSLLSMVVPQFEFWLLLT